MIAPRDEAVVRKDIAAIERQLSALQSELRQIERARREEWEALKRRCIAQPTPEQWWSVP